MSGKGDTQRPSSVSRKEFETNWNRIFKKDITVKKSIYTDGTPCFIARCSTSEQIGYGHSEEIAVERLNIAIANGLI